MSDTQFASDILSGEMLEEEVSCDECGSAAGPRALHPGGVMKQMIVMRTDLGMRKGKMIAQGAHASLAVVVNNAPDPRIDEWLAGAFTKICVRVESEMELLDIYEKAKSTGLLTELITDNGLTEFNGVPTRTCIAIGPDTAENLAPITGHLRLL
ncbi:peptidyl tRNA hydrolase [Mycobacterium phage Pound]|nr:peptidyl tRNA hydrolase [Mycobacterium phage Pound]